MVFWAGSAFFFLMRSASCLVTVGFLDGLCFLIGYSGFFGWDLLPDWLQCFFFFLAGICLLISYSGLVGSAIGYSGTFLGSAS